MARTRSQAGKYSVSKGKRAERRFATSLAEWTGKAIRRVPNSGGWNKSGSTVVGGKEFSSDVISDVPMIFTIEIKSGVGFSLDAVLNNPSTSIFTKWWGQACHDACASNKLPMLIFKPDRSFDWVAIDGRGVDRLIDDNDSIRSIKIDGYANSYNFAVSSIGGRKKHNVTLDLPNPYIYRWKDFISVVDPNLLFGHLLIEPD